LKWLSELTSWLRLVRLLRLYPLLRSLVVLSLTVRWQLQQHYGMAHLLCNSTPSHSSGTGYHGNQIHMLHLAGPLQPENAALHAIIAVAGFARAIYVSIPGKLPGLRLVSHGIGSPLLHLAVYLSTVVLCTAPKHTRNISIISSQNHTCRYYTAVAEGLENSWLRSVGTPPVYVRS
jgi:hypothetical protein